MPDSFQPLFIFSFFQTQKAFSPPRGASFLWDLLLLLLVFTYRLFLSVEAEACSEV